MTTLKIDEDAAEKVRAAGRERARKSRERRKAQKAVERTNTEDALIEAAVVQALMDTSGMSATENAERQRVIRSVVHRALDRLHASGVTGSLEKTRARLTHLQRSALGLPSS